MKDSKKKVFIYVTIAALALVLAVFLGLRWLGNMLDDRLPGIAISQQQHIDITPQQIQSIRDIGQWEVLTIADEEVADTMRKGFFTDDHLVRIYYGYVRLGVDMSHLTDDAVTFRGDTLILHLPPVDVLDQDFIDEAMTRSFYQSGSWDGSAREALYRQAHQKMLRRARTPENLRRAEELITTQMHQFLRALGFEQVEVRLNSPTQKLTNSQLLPQPLPRRQ